MGLSIRSLMSMVVILGMVFAIMNILITEGANNYNAPIDPGLTESFNKMNESAEIILNQTYSDQEDTENIGSETIFDSATVLSSGSKLVKIVTGTYKGTEASLSSMKELSSFLPIPPVLWTTLSTLLLITCVALVIYSIRRFRDDTL